MDSVLLPKLRVHLPDVEDDLIEVIPGFHIILLISVRKKAWFLSICLISLPCDMIEPCMTVYIRAQFNFIA